MKKPESNNNYSAPISIGIDPDSDKSGIAYFDGSNVYVNTFSFSELLDDIRDLVSMPDNKDHCTVYVEAGYLNASNWHLTYSDNARIAAKKGMAVGRNHETARKIIEMLNHMGIRCEAVKPLAKHWKGKDGKITHAELSAICPLLKQSRTNQEERDALLIAMHYHKINQFKNKIKL